jgi:hypothetical protein
MNYYIYLDQPVTEILPADIHTTIIKVTPTTYKSFQELIQRGANLWPDAPPEIKEFADLITTGRILQDYHGQDTSGKVSKN